MNTVLYVPAAGDPHGVLAPGKCGSRPPCAIRLFELRERHAPCLDCDTLPHGDDAPLHCRECHEDWPCGQPDRVTRPEGWGAWSGETWSRPDALVLAWEGVSVGGGCDRAVRLLLAYAPFCDTCFQVDYDPEHAVFAANKLVEHFGGEVVAL